jgi:hypothetical protein
MRMATLSASARLGSRAHKPSGEFRDVVGHQREAGAGAGREIGGTTRAVLAGNAFEPPQKIPQEIRSLLHDISRGIKSSQFASDCCR